MSKSILKDSELLQNVKSSILKVYQMQQANPKTV